LPFGARRLAHGECLLRVEAVNGPRTPNRLESLRCPESPLKCQECDDANYFDVKLRHGSRAGARKLNREYCSPGNRTDLDPELGELFRRRRGPGRARLNKLRNPPRIERLDHQSQAALAY